MLSVADWSEQLMNNWVFEERFKERNKTGESLSRKHKL